MIEHDSSVRMIILVNTSQLLHFKNIFDPWASWDSGQQQINPCSDRPSRCFNMSWHSLRFTERPWCSCWAIQLFQKPDQNVVLFWWFWNLSEVTLLIFLLAIWNETFRVCKYEASTIIDEQTLRELQGELDTPGQISSYDLERFGLWSPYSMKVLK